MKYKHVATESKLYLVHPMKNWLLDIDLITVIQINKLIC